MVSEEKNESSRPGVHCNSGFDYIGACGGYGGFYCFALNP